MVARLASNNSGSKASARERTKWLSAQASAKEAKATTASKHLLERNHGGQASAKKRGVSVAAKHLQS